MKVLFSLLFLSITINIYSQSNQIIGDYKASNEAFNGLIIYKLKLNPDGSFEFHSYDRIDNRLEKERNQYAKGTWKSVNNLVYFYADKDVDFDEKYTLDFNNIKARFITKSPRDKSDRDIKTALLFYESDIFWIVRWKFIKQ